MELDAALVEYREAIKTQERLNDKDPSNATWLSSLAIAYRAAGSVLRQQGKLEEALGNYGKVLTFREQLFNKDRVNPGRQKALATGSIDVADVKTEWTRNFDVAAREPGLRIAVELYRSAIRILDELRPRYDGDVFDCYMKIGDIQMLQVHPDAGLKEYQAASGIALEKTKEASDVAWQRRLANSDVKIGDTLAAQKLASEAVKQYEKALGIATTLARKYPQSTEWTSKTEELNKKIQDLATTGAPP